MTNILQIQSQIPADSITNTYRFNHKYLTDSYLTDSITNILLIHILQIQSRIPYPNYRSD